MPTGTSEAEIVIERILDAPRERVWAAWTEPHHIAAWWGPKGFTTRVESLDFRHGGTSHYIMTGPDGTEYPVTGVFQEISAPKKIVTTDEFGDDYEAPDDKDLPHGIVLTVTFDDLGDKTRLTLRIAHPTPEDRKRHEEMGVVEGWGSTLDCLEDHLQNME